jgi:hypothetical protein
MALVVHGEPLQFYERQHAAHQEDSMKASRLLCATTLGFVSATAFGCASERTEPKNPSYETLKTQEVESEREEFIQEKRQQISEVQKEMQELQRKIDQDSASVDERQRAEWRNVLFELEQERSHLDAELDRAQSVNHQEWEVMRGDIPVAVDSLQAGVTKLGNDVTNLFTSDSAKVSSDSGLCPVRVSKVDTEIETKDDSVLVELTTSEEKDVADLRQRAMALSKNKTYKPGRLEQAGPGAGPSQAGESAAPRSPSDGITASNGPGSASTATTEQRGEAATMGTDDAAVLEPIPLRRVSVQNIEDGVRITFVVASAERDKLREQVSKDAERLEAGACEDDRQQQASAAP